MNREILVNIIDFIPEPTFAVDTEKKIIACNKAIEKILGVKRENILGKDCREYSNLVYGVKRPLFVEIVFEVNEEIEKFFSDIKKKDNIFYGETFIPGINRGKGGYFMVMAAPIVNEKGNFIGAMETIKDITEKKQAEEALRKSEEKYRNIFENAIEGMYQSNPEGRYITVNPSMARMLGYESPHDMISTITNIEEQVYVNSEDRKRFKMLMERDGFVNDFETQLYRKDGSTIWASINGRAILDSSGKPIYYEGFVLDITRRKVSELKLKEEMGFNRALIENSPAFYIAISPDGRVLFMNKSLLKVLGYSAKDVIGKDCLTNFIPPEERDSLSKVFEMIINQREQTVSENHIIGKDGSKRLVQWHGMPIVDKNNKIEYFFGVGIDITERKKAEKHLEEERHKFFLLAENAPFGLALIDRDGRFTYINTKFKEMFGYDLDDTPDGKTWCRKAYPDPEYRHKVIATWLNDVEKFRQNPQVREGKQWTFTVTCKDNTQKIISFIPVRLPTDSYLMTYEDITELKQLQSQLLHSQKMEALGAFVGGVAHDFNNILTAVMGYAGLAMTRIDDKERLKGYISHVINASEKATDLTKKLLSFARKQEIKLEPIDINNVIKDSMGLLKRIIREDIELDFSLGQDKIIVLADKVQIEQVLINLVANARDAMPEGGKIKIHTSLTYIDNKFIEKNRFGKPGNYALITISDTGTGIDEALKDKIFEPFFTTKDISKGTGLGLSIVYGIIKQHNGYIDLKSQLGHGTSFMIYLPLAEKEKKPLDKGENKEIKGGEETIFIAEDDEMVRIFEKDILEGQGYKVIDAIDGEDALMKYSLFKDKIDLVILDVVMPKKNGKEVYDEIRNMDPEIPVLFTSGYAFDIIAQKGIDADKTDIVYKPILYNHLLKKVREILDKTGKKKKT
ncbi:MAG TPA: PAS domain S-box protein [Syntrophorhabdaceae bacterium]|nr:PAS domain S-box protein [Syntrophorhabdaceae bacterium]